MVKKLLFAVIGTVLGVVMLNAICALGERLAYGAFWGQDQPKGLYVHQAGERPRLKPNARLNGMLYQISVNSMGFRGPELQQEKPNNGLRIWCVGGSTTFDIFAPDDSSAWPMQLQTSLQQSLPNRTVEVVNAGIPGEILWGSISDFEKFQKNIQADYVVIYHGPNDLRQVATTPMHGRGPQKPPSGPPPSEGLINDILGKQAYALVRVLRRTIEPVRPLRTAWQQNRLTQHQLQDLKGRHQKFIRVARQYRAVPILVSHALRAKPTDSGEQARKRVAESAHLLQMYPEAVIDAFKQYNLMLKQLSQQERLPFADVRAAVPADTANWGDATHFLAPGSKLAAETIGKEILRLEK